jgi:hypothetical protein
MLKKIYQLDLVVIFVIAICFESFSWLDLFFSFISWYLISFYFYVKFGIYSFNCYLFYFKKYFYSGLFFFSILSFNTKLIGNWTFWLNLSLGLHGLRVWKFNLDLRDLSGSFFLCSCFFNFIFQYLFIY